MANNAISNTYVYHVIDNHGCEYTDEIEVQFYEAPRIELGESIPYCDSAMLNGTLLSTPLQGVTYTYTWSNNQFLTPNNGPIAEANNLDTLTLFHLTVQSVQDADCFTQDSVQVYMVDAPPVVEFAETLCAGDPIDLIAPFADNYSYSWYVYNVQPDTVITEYIQGETASQYSIGSTFYQTYYADVTENVCNKMSTSVFQVITGECQVTFPNLITGYTGSSATSISSLCDEGAYGNDAFHICGLFGLQGDITGSTLQVFNRWGELVFESMDYRNDWVPSELSDGVYYYILKWNRPEPKFYNGDFSVIRSK
jgi:hypothetical protein